MDKLEKRRQGGINDAGAENEVKMEEERRGEC